LTRAMTVMLVISPSETSVEINPFVSLLTHLSCLRNQQNGLDPIRLVLYSLPRVELTCPRRPDRPCLRHRHEPDVDSFQSDSTRHRGSIQPSTKQSRKTLLRNLGDRSFESLFPRQLLYRVGGMSSQDSVEKRPYCRSGSAPYGIGLIVCLQKY